LEIEMPFAKMKLCDSTDVALNIFEMFKNNKVNLVCTGEYDDDFNVKLVPESDPNWAPMEDEPNPYDRTPYNAVAKLLKNERMELRVHDLEAWGKQYERIESRLVQVFLREHLDWQTIIFSVVVSRQYMDGDEVSGWSRWSMECVEVRVCKRKGQKNHPERQVFKFRCAAFGQKDTLSNEMKRYVGAFVRYDHPHYEKVS
jgi:hypothetical protein